MLKQDALSWCILFVFVLCLGKEATLTKGLQIKINGIVQGVGFRPFIYKLANDFDITGSVINNADGVLIKAFGERVYDFKDAIIPNAPKLAKIINLISDEICEQAPIVFKIDFSRQGLANTFISPDAAICPDCVDEIMHQDERRFGYAFTNCTNCGPRFSIIDTIPYDRKNTRMRDFIMCEDCQSEYENPIDRRFHAQPIACPKCGPHLWFEDLDGNKETDNAISVAVDKLRSGQVIAIKGLSGFHLACDATNKLAVELLRQRKRRPHKPFALMLRDVDAIAEYVSLSKSEEFALGSPAAPIVLIKGSDSRIVDDVAPNLDRLGFMVAATPLHYILCDAFKKPLVMTSGNLSGEPQVIDNDEAKEKLGAFVDGFLFHNREIARRLDDSVAFAHDDEIIKIRHARGFAPSPIVLPNGFENTPPILAMGAEMKSAICLLRGHEAIISHHIGELGSVLANSELEKAVEDYCHIYDHDPKQIVIDKHPEYFSSKLGDELAQKNDLNLIKVQHHHAHFAAVLGENLFANDGDNAIGIMLDGTGLGDDGNLWGGEMFIGNYCEFKRVTNLTPFRLAGGAQAILHPFRTLLGALYAAFGIEAAQNIANEFGLGEKSLPIFKLLQSGLNSPNTTSAGRLFDAVAAALGICRDGISYEAQAAIELEAITNTNVNEFYNLPFENGVIDTKTMWEEILFDINSGLEKSVISAKFQNGLAKSFANVASYFAGENHIKTVALSGGVMQNRYLLMALQKELQNNNLTVLVNKDIPANDGGIAFGQALIAAAKGADNV